MLENHWIRRWKRCAKCLSAFLSGFSFMPKNAMQNDTSYRFWWVLTPPDTCRAIRKGVVVATFQVLYVFEVLATVSPTICSKMPFPQKFGWKLLKKPFPMSLHRSPESWNICRTMTFTLWMMGGCWGIWTWTLGKSWKNIPSVWLLDKIWRENHQGWWLSHWFIGFRDGWRNAAANPFTVHNPKTKGGCKNPQKRMDFSVDDFHFASLKKKSASGSGSGLKNLSKRLIKKGNMVIYRKFPPIPSNKKIHFLFPPVFLLHRLVLGNLSVFFCSNQVT